MKIAFAPSIPWQRDRDTYQPGSGPNPLCLEQLLMNEGIESIIIDPHQRPWNPFGSSNTLLQSLDPLRALQIGYGYQGLDAVISVFEGAATSLGLLRPIALHRPKIILWDIGLTDWRLRNKIIDFTLPRIDHLMVLGKNQLDYIAIHHAPCRSASAIGHMIDTDFYRPSPLNMAGPILSVGDDIGRDFATLGRATQGLGRALIVKASRHPPELNGEDVRVIRERISHVALRELYEQASIVVVPTRTTPNACGVSTILEASACGRPLIVTDNPGIRDFIVPGETCLTVPDGDTDAMRSAVSKLLAEPQTCERLATNARVFAMEHCAYPVFAKRLAAELRFVVAGTRRV